MDPITASYIWVAVFVIGLVLLFAAVFRKNAGPLKGVNPILAAVIGVALVLVGGFWGVMPNLPDQPIQQQIIIDTPLTAAPAFSIDAAAVTTNIWNSAVGDCITTSVLDATETVLTVPITVNTGGTHDAFAVNFTALNLTVTPVPPTGSDANDLATVYFESDYNMKYEQEYVLRADGAQTTFFANWTRVGDTTDIASWDHTGQDTMLLTESETYQVAYCFDGGESTLGNVFKTVGESLSWSVTVHNADWSWSKIYTVTAIVIVST